MKQSFVWRPTNLSEEAQRVLMVPSSPTRQMSRGALEMEIISKVKRLAEDAEDNGGDVQSLLHIDPDISSVTWGVAFTPDEIAQNVMFADSLSQLFHAAELKSAPVQDPDLREELEWQSLSEWLQDLNNASTY
ncbi:MAG: hypothetical protein ACQEUN_05040 [Pseudomonadota bacterium]